MIFRLFLLSFVMLASCASPQPANQAAAPVAGITWPSPPQEARVRFIDAFSGAEDLDIRPSLFNRFKNAIAGKKNMGMIRPYAVSVHENRVLVGDPGLHAVHLFDLARRTFLLISVVEEEPLSSPVGVALGENRLFIADSTLGKVFILDSEGELLTVISGLERPTGLAFDASSRRLYVADTLAHRIVVFDDEGTRLFEFGERGVQEGEFNFPSHISLSGSHLLVNDSMNFRIQAFDLDGRFLSAFGDHGNASGYFSQPKGVAADSRGHVYVAGATIDRVQVFSPDGQFLLALGNKGNGPGEFVMPTGVTIADDRIYVADSYNSRVQIFEYVGGD